MLNNFLEIITLLRYPLSFLFIILWIFSFYWKPIFKISKLKTYNNVQRVHDSEISRLGGLVLYLFLWSLSLLGFFDDLFLRNILFASIPFALVSFIEDLFHNTQPKVRLISMLMSCLIFFYLNPIQFPIIDIPFLGKLINIYPISIIFFSFSVIVIMNGMNLVDGMHGLFGFTAFFQLLSITYISLIYNHFELVNLTLILLIILIIFLLFNFPFGKIFAGDLGAYFFGFINSLLIIYLFGKNSQLLTWSAILILFYPCFELLFSFVRKLRNNLSPFDADDKHLHTLINKKLFKKIKKKVFINSLTSLSLFFFWLIPFIFIVFFFNNFVLLNFSILLLIFLYSFFYRCMNN